MPTNFVINNPWGLLSLLAIPVILAIHFLQRKAQTVVISTLFLLPAPKREAQRGYRFNRLVNSLPLWMQLLCALLLSLLLAQPRYVDVNSTLRVAIVLDSSASMSVFQDYIEGKLSDEVKRLKGDAHNLELWLLESDLSKDRIYHGSSLNDALSHLNDWSPNAGASSADSALRVARSLAGKKGAVIYLSDTPVDEVNYGANFLSVGKKESNVGFTGVRFRQEADGMVWEATVKNYSDEPVKTQWYIAYPNGQKSKIRMLELAEDELKVIQGLMPDDVQKAELFLEADVFNEDNYIPLLAPKVTPLFIGNDDDQLTGLAKKILENFDDIHIRNQEIDLGIRAQEVGDIPARSYASLITLKEPKKSSGLKVYRYLSADHPLMEGLNWQGFLLVEENRFQLEEGDEVLLWGDDEPLIFLRSTPEDNLNMILNFSLEGSSAFRQEAFVIFLYRYIEWVRDQKPQLIIQNTELNQVVSLTHVENNSLQSPQYLVTTNLDGSETSRREFPSFSKIITPPHAGFFHVEQEGVVVFTAANLFADTREADFRNCGTSRIESSIKSQAEEFRLESAVFWRVCLLFVFLCLLVSWASFGGLVFNNATPFSKS